MPFTPDHDLSPDERALREHLSPNAATVARVINAAKHEPQKSSPRWLAPAAAIAMVTLLAIGAWWLLTPLPPPDPAPPCALKPRADKALLSDRCGEVAFIPAAGPSADTSPHKAKPALTLPVTHTKRITNHGDAVLLVTPDAPPRLTLIGGHR